MDSVMLMQNNYVGFDIAMEKITLSLFYNVLISKYITWIKLVCIPGKIYTYNILDLEHLFDILRNINAVFIIIIYIDGFV